MHRVKFVLLFKYLIILQCFANQNSPNNYEKVEQKLTKIDNHKNYTDKVDPARNITTTNRLRYIRKIPGGITEEDIEDPKYSVLLKESLKKYHMDSHLQQYHKVVEVSKITTQLVAGVLTKLYFKIAPTNCKVNRQGHATSRVCVVAKNSNIQSCKSEILEKQWINFKEIQVTCNKRKRAILGGPSEKDRNDPKFIALVQESLNKYLQTSGSTQHHHIVEIEKVTSQVVAGTLITIDFTIAPTICSSETDVHIDTPSCQMLENIGNKKCQSRIWEKPWENFKEINVSCNENGILRTKETPVGAQIEKNPNDPEFIALAEESMSKYLQTSGTTRHYKLVKIKKVTWQLVEGFITRIAFIIAATNCKSNEFDVSNCKILRSPNIKKCYSKIWQKPWEDFREINVTCRRLIQKTTKNRQLRS